MKYLSSPFLMTAFNLVARSLFLIFLTPVLSLGLAEEQLLYWAFLVSCFMIQGLLDFGFSQTFIRLISGARSGVALSAILGNRASGSRRSDRGGGLIKAAAGRAYLALSILLFVLICIFGWWGFVSYPEYYQDKEQKMLVFMIMLAFAPLNLLMLKNFVLMCGDGQVAKANLISASVLVVSFLAVIILTLLGEASLPSICLLYQGGVFISLLIMRERREKKNSCRKKDVNIVFFRVLKISVQSGIGIFFSLIFYQAVGIYFSTNLPLSQGLTVIYLMQIARAIASFSQAVFYSRIPDISQRFYSSGPKQAMEFGMKMAFKMQLLFGLASIASIFVYEVYESAVVKNVFEPRMWLLLCACVSLERAIGVLMQMYSMTNHILWHRYNSMVAFVTAIPIYVFGSFYSFLMGYAFAIILCNFLILHPRASSVYGSLRGYYLKVCIYPSSIYLLIFGIMGMVGF
ncbi:hypothetical protein [Spongiibacter sp. UBA1325]|uniref:hypothetical protein n=1 Tax=Spongiibacter sp. UBA1325 TaxID=1947543 RepID=UPI00257A0F52|nr:hypothetical protein [Spongiibacter sp. UBA1325]|tara:strand:- start:1655 stop:3031 length:1377 start_codon:yes stop_codon:yes gene_type:complete